MKKCFLISTLSLISTVSSFSQWSNNTAVNTPVCTALKYQLEVKVISDGKGGAIAAWLDHRNDGTIDSSNADVFVQRIDKNGYAKWSSVTFPVNGIGICTNPSDQPSLNLVTDGASGAIVIWRDMRNGNDDIYAQKIDSSGNIIWPVTNGLPVFSDTNKQKGAKAVSDGAGGVIVACEYKVNGSGNWDIHINRLDASGAQQWGPSGQKLSGSFEDEKDPRIESDGTGGAIVVWTLVASAPFDYDVVAQKVDASGAAKWAPGGVYVCTDPAFQVDPKIEPDGVGGAIIVWMDSITTGVADIFSQRIDATNGSKLWNGGTKVSVCTDTSYQGAHDIASEGINGAVVAWKDHRGGNKDIYAQKLDLATGNSIWAQNGIPIAATMANEGNPNLWGDGTGSVICVYQDSMVSGSQVVGNITAQKIDGNGTLLWAAGGAPVSTAPNQQTQPKHVPDGGGGAIFFFMDNRSSVTDYNIYVHHLFWNGTENGIVEHSNLFETTISPNPFNESAIVSVTSFHDSEPVKKLEVFDIFGRPVNFDILQMGDSFLIRRNGNNCGFYFYVIRSNDRVIGSGKFIIID